MDQQLIEKTKTLIKDSQLNKETKAQLLSLMDFINYPEVKERILNILDLEREVTDIEIQYLKDMNKRFRNSDLFGYGKQGSIIPANTRKNLESNNTVGTTNLSQQSTGNPVTQTAQQPQNANINSQSNTPNLVQPNVGTL